MSFKSRGSLKILKKSQDMENVISEKGKKFQKKSIIQQRKQEEINHHKILQKILI